MAFIIPTLSALGGAVATGGAGAALAAGGTILGTMGAVQAGKSASVMANYQADLADRRANEERATSIKEAQNRKHQGDLLTSRARAVGAASGGGLDLDLMGDLEEETEMRALNAIWEGESRATDYENQAREKRWEGKQRKRAGYMKGVSTLLSGGASLMDNYGATA